MPSTEGILSDILRREGGFINHPADRGGPTNFGITLATLTEYRGRPASVDELKALTPVDAELIYRVQYVYKFDAVKNDELRALIVDSAVNHGVGRATQWLQEALGVRADGQIGPISRAALGALDQEGYAKVYRTVLRKRAIFYGQIVKRDPSQAAFIEGWLRRLAEFI